MNTEVLMLEYIFKKNKNNLAVIAKINHNGLFLRRYNQNPQLHMDGSSMFFKIQYLIDTVNNTTEIVIDPYNFNMTYEIERNHFKISRKT